MNQFKFLLIYTKPCLCLSSILLLCSLFFCSNKNNLSEQVYIKTSDTELFAHIRGDSNNSQIILYLHGGPANPIGVPIFLEYSGHQLEKQFIVVYLYQRGIGKSPSVPIRSQKIENYVSDINFIVDYLRERFPNKKINIIGHSYGGVLAYHYLIKHDDKISKLIAINSAFKFQSMINARYQRTVDWAKEVDNQQAIEELSNIKGPPYGDTESKIEQISKWSIQAYDGMFRNILRQRIDQLIRKENWRNNWVEESTEIRKKLSREGMNMDLKNMLHNVKTPFLLLGGKLDVQVPWESLKNELDCYGGPKTFLLFEKSHHLIFVDEENLFVKKVTDFFKS